MNTAEKGISPPAGQQPEKNNKQTQIVPIADTKGHKGSIERNIAGLSPSEYLPKVLSYIPDDFNGSLLEFPAGNQAYTAGKFQKLSGAAITVVDSNDTILLETQQAYEKAGLRYISFQDGDTARLRHEDASFDYVVCINGFHSFADNVSTFREAARVLKKGGHLCGCCYIRKQGILADLMVNLFHVRKGAYVPPFHTYGEMEKNFYSLYSKVELTTIKSALIFHCIK